MELVTIDRSVLIRLAVMGRSEGQLSLAELINAVKTDFSFHSAPEGIPGPDGGLEFLHGVVGSVPLTKLGIYNDGVVLNAASPTEKLDQALEVLIEWSKARFDVSITETHEVNRMYESNIVVKASSGILDLNKKLLRVQKELQVALGAASGVDEQFSVVSLTISPDLQRWGGMKPSPFRIGRHPSADFSSNLFHSTAPLTTDRHLKVLAMLEEVGV